MADAALIFKSEIFYGDLLISLQPTECNRVGFDLIYKIDKKTVDEKVIVAIARTAMICYDYNLKKVTGLPEAAKNKLFP
jgi:acyl-CoA thioesterase FadM